MRRGTRVKRNLFNNVLALFNEAKVDNNLSRIRNFLKELSDYDLQLLMRQVDPEFRGIVSREILNRSGLQSSRNLFGSGANRLKIGRKILY